MFADVVSAGNRRAFPVAFAAEVGNVHLIGKRFGIGGRQDVMGSMAFAAIGCIKGIQPLGLPVDPLIEFGGFPVVAIATVDRRQDIRMRKFLHGRPGMAGSAFHAFMDRIDERFSIDIQGNCLALPDRCQGRVIMAHQAIFIALGKKIAGLEERDYNNENQPLSYL